MRAVRQLGESEGGLDDADVRERLREVPEEAAALGVVLLGDQAEVVSAARGSRS